MITNKRDYLQVRHYVLIEIYSEPSRTTFIKYEETTKVQNIIIMGLLDGFLQHLKMHNIITDYAISSI